MKGLRRSKAINFDSVGNNEEDEILYGGADDDDGVTRDIEEGDVDADDDLLQEVEGQLAIVKLQQNLRSYGSAQPYILTCYKNGALEITNLPDADTKLGEKERCCFKAFQLLSGENY